MFDSNFLQKVGPLTQTMQLLTLIATIISAVVLSTWAISSKINGIRLDLTAKMQILETALTSRIQSLQTELAVMKKSEEGRDEKINRMWDWWMTSLEQGWSAHMKNRQRNTQ